MSVINPENARDFLIKKNKVRALIKNAEVGSDFFEELNRLVMQLVLKANDRRRSNHRKRVMKQDL